ADIFPHLLDMAYKQLLRMERRAPDEEGLHLFERALLTLMDSISSGKSTAGGQWKLDHNATKTGKEEPPNVTTKSGYVFPRTHFGWYEDNAANLEHPPRTITVGYIDGPTVERRMLYITQDARKELLILVSKLPGGE